MEAFRTVIIDIVAEMAQRIKSAEERVRNPFVNRTNVYRCEDGRPICYCCLRVGHVAKYCWDRRYSRPHVSVKNPPTPEQFPQHDSLDVQSLGRDVDRLLKELQRIANDVELLRTPPFRAEGVPRIPDSVTEEDVRQCKVTEPVKMTPNAYQRCPNYAERPFVRMCQPGHTAPNVIRPNACCDVT